MLPPRARGRASGAAERGLSGRADCAGRVPRPTAHLGEAHGKGLGWWGGLKSTDTLW